MSRALPPALLLLAYGIASGRAALGGGLLVGDDHPGQLYRLYHAVALGWAPWRLNPGWWAGYAELQYYPPGAAWLGAAIHQGSLGAVAVPAAYQAVLWIAWLLPGLATFALLTRLLGSGWLALPGAFVALSLVGWVDGARRTPLTAAPLVAAVILLHPAHAPVETGRQKIGRASCRERV